MSGPKSTSNSTNGPVDYTKAIVIDVLLALYLVACVVFVFHTFARSYSLLDRSGAFDEARGERRLHTGHFVYYLFCRGIERNNLGSTTAWSLGRRAWLPARNNGWPTPVDGDLTLEVQQDPERGLLSIWALDGGAGAGKRLGDPKQGQKATIELEIQRPDGAPLKLSLDGQPTSDQPGWYTKFEATSADLEGLYPLQAKATVITPEGKRASVDLAAGSSTPPLLILTIVGVALGVLWSVLGMIGVFPSPAQRMFGLAPRRQLAPDEKKPAFLSTFNGVFVSLALLLTLLAGWFMIEVNLTSLTSQVRLNRMGAIFTELLDFTHFGENWAKATDGDPSTGSSWDLLEEAVPKMIETLFLAMMATMFAIPIAFALSFLAARNLMEGNALSMAVYYAVRMMMNIVRSVEPLAWCIIASVWVGAGTFAGVLALAVHSVAALTKLYSEQIEGVDQGPMEAIRATGASGLQLLRFGVVPQIIPPFLSFTMYRWDINVRMAPILGFVGGGGIGVLLKQNFDQLLYANVGVIILLITILVAAMDFASAHIRGKLM